MMFATNPDKAKEWAKETPNMKNLPEKKHPQVNRDRQPLHVKISGDGMFHKNAHQSAKGRFFEEAPGRSDARFYEKIAEADDLSSSLESGSGGADMAGGSGEPGEEMGGGMYGTGEPEPMPKPKRPRPSLKSMFNIAGPGKTRPAVKVASAAPSDWEADVGIATGFHRPAKEQPESLETGGERFHSSLAKTPGAGAAAGVRHGVREGGSLSLPASSTSNLGKHAVDWESVKNYSKARLDEAKDSLSSGAGDLSETADKAIRGITHSPAGTAIAGLVGLKMLGRGGRGIARGAGRLFGRKHAPPPSLLGSVAGGLRRLVGGK